MKTESGLEKINTGLVIIVDPPNQNPAIASARVDEFVQRGGKGVLVGGSGAIESAIFQDTVAAIIEVTTQFNSVPVWMLPGHINQMLEDVRGLIGVLNYKYILGSGGNTFDRVYPQEAQELVSKTLQARKIPSIPTLYVLCGDPNASVTKECGILPLNFAFLSVSKRFLENTSVWLRKGVDCIYFESGSNTPQPVNQDTVIRTRQLINEARSRVSLFVSGGIKSPSSARAFAGIADYVVVGGHFERNGVKEVPEFVAALKNGLS